MAIISKEELISAASTISLNERVEMISRKDRLFEAPNRNAKTVFLSHSHQDQDVIKEAVAILSKLGVSVYVDWMDKAMPAKTTGETASKLKDRIKNCNKFVLLASPEAIRSNWVNWELGYGDSHKYLNDIALFPVVQAKNNSWNEAEYLQIYPHIEEVDTGIYNSKSWFVIFPDGSRIALKDWLNK